MSEQHQERKIVVTEDGPYLVYGSIPLKDKKQVVSEHGEPMTWETTGNYQLDDEDYALCRCGHSGNKPYCDGSHKSADWDSTMTAPTEPSAERQEIHPGGTGIVVKRDYAICANSGYCGTRLANIKKMTPQTDESVVRAQVMRMIEKCPSGSYTYALEEGGENIEPDLPEAISCTTDVLSSGPVRGALWVTGNIPIERGDGEPLETRNRVTLCRCGLSGNKPLCDGSHRKEGDGES